MRSSETYLRKVLSGLVHGIRNPLHGISASVSAASCFLEDRPAAQPFLQMILKDVSKLTALMDRTQQLFDDVSPDSTSHPVGAVIGDGLRQVQDLALASGSSISLLDETFGLQIRCDSHRLSRAFAALIENAVESGQGVRVEIAVRRIGIGETGVTITDNGAGIAAVDLPRVFEPFFTTRLGKFGLGATLAEAVIKAHGGKISITSEEGRGTWVQIFLPIDV